MKKLENAEQKLHLSNAARARIGAALEAESTKTKQNKTPMRWVAAAAAVVLTAALLTTGVLHRPSAQPTAEKKQTEFHSVITGESLRLCITQMQSSGQSVSTELKAGNEIFVEPARQMDNNMLYAFEALDIAAYDCIYVKMRGFNDDTAPDIAVTNSDWQFTSSDMETAKEFGVYVKTQDDSENAPKEYVLGYACDNGKFYVTAPTDGETVVYTVTAENDTETVSVDLRLRAVDGKVGVTVENEQKYVK